MNIIKLLFGLLCFHKDNIADRKCLSCHYYSRGKCFFYRVLFKEYVLDLAQQIEEQKLATEEDALPAEEARKHIYLCGPEARHWIRRYMGN